MTGRVCSAKCQGYMKSMDRYWDLIAEGVINHPDVLEAWDRMHEGNEERWERFKKIVDKYHPDD